jgi:hypothetical protein
MKKKRSAEKQGLVAWFNQTLDRISDYLSARKGLLPLIGILLVLANFALQFVPVGWVGESNFLLHLGIIIAIIGILLAWAL